MKATLLILTLSTAFITACSSGYLAQNGEYDGVYDPGGDVIDAYAYEQTNEELDPQADFDYVDPNFDPNQQNPYEYSSRIRRFHTTSSFGYYDPYYTNMGWYDPNPNNFGTSIYSDAWMTNNYYGSNYPYSGWGTSTGWNSYSGWNFGNGYSWGWGSVGAYGPNYGYNPWYSPYYGYNPWNPWSPWNCPSYYNSFDVMSQVVYAPRGQNSPSGAGYTQNAYEGAVRRGEIQPPSASDDNAIASTERAVPTSPRTVKNERPTDVVEYAITMERSDIPAQSGRAVTKAVPDQIVSRDVQTRANTYLRQKEMFRNGGFPIDRGRNSTSTQQRADVPRFLQNFESFINGTESSRPNMNRGYVPSLNQNEGHNFNRGNSTPRWNTGGGSTPSYDRGSTPRFNIGGGSGGSGGRGGSGGSNGSSGGSRGGGRR